MAIFSVINKINTLIHVNFYHLFIVGLTLLHSERPKLYTILAFLSAIGLKTGAIIC